MHRLALLLVLFNGGCLEWAGLYAGGADEGRDAAAADALAPPGDLSIVDAPMADAPDGDFPSPDLGVLDMSPDLLGADLPARDLQVLVDLAPPVDLALPVVWSRLVPMDEDGGVLGPFDLHAAWGDTGDWFFVGDAGTLLRTRDDGLTWRVAGFDFGGTALYAVWGVVDDDKFIAGAGGQGVAGGNGDGWSEMSTGTAQALRGIWEHDVTSDGGLTSYVFAVGDGGTVLGSTDFGATWSARPSGTQVALRCVRGTRSGSLWVVGDGGTILTSSDWGRSFAPQASGTTGTLYALWATSKGEVYAVGAKGTILHSADGKIWAPQPSGTTEDLRAITVASSGEAWAVGTHGAAVHKPVGGAWAPEGTGTTATLEGLWRDSGTSHVLAVGSGGTILRHD